MNKKASNNKRFQILEVWHFIIHLRWHYQVFILSGGFLAGGFLSSAINWNGFWVQFLNVHLLLFGGATAYNSYWDKDKGPVGGLLDPPPMHRWMWIASIFIQLLGLWVAFYSGVLFAVVYLSSMLFFWLYSSPYFRWKGKPLLSLAAIGISTGTNSLLMGYLAAGNNTMESHILMASAGVALMILSIYPASQLYQIDEDHRRGDETFAIKFGFVGVMYFFRTAFTGGVLLLGLSIIESYLWVGITFAVISSMAGLWVDYKLRTLATETNHYALVMKIKYVTSIAFILFFSALLLWDYLRLN